MKIFYVSLQRSGTKSFGNFFKKNGYQVLSWPQSYSLNLNQLILDGQWLHFLKSGLIEKFDVFEDSPFWVPELVSFIYQYVPDSRFVYFSRPSADWYRSMVTHSDGLTLGSVDWHCYWYDRLDDLEMLRDNGRLSPKKLPMLGMQRHYERIFLEHERKVKARFARFDASRFFVGHLYDKDKYKQMAEHFSLKLDDTADEHIHKSKRTVSDVLDKHRFLY